MVHQPSGFSSDLEDEASTPIISTGNSDIDGKLGGGIPVGSLTLIEGQSASGKSVLTQQFIWGSLWENYKVVLYSTERTVKSHMKQMESLGLDVTDFLLMGMLKIFPIHEVSGLDPGVVLKALVDDINAHEEYDLAVVDSLTPMVTPLSVVDVIAFFERCRALCSKRITIVVTLHSYSLDESARDRVRSMCDANIHMRVDNVGDQLVNVMAVLKVSGATMSTGNIVSFVIEPMIGLRIVPISYTRV